MNEADTRARYIDSKLKESGWDDWKIDREYPINAGRVFFCEKVFKRSKKPQSADYLLRYEKK